MRPALLLLTLLVPLAAGCLAGPAAVRTELSLFTRGVSDDPTPQPLPTCDDLLQVLNARALAEAAASLQASVEGHGWAIDVDFAMEDTMAAPAFDRGVASAADGAGGSSSRVVTLTNNQEGGADEGDVLKTDGLWTYVLGGDGALHVILHAYVGDATEVRRLELGGWGEGHLLLASRDPADGDDDRLVVVLPHAAPDADERSLLAAPMRERVQHGMARVLVLSLADRAEPTILSETFVEGSVAGVRLVDGVAHIVVQRFAGDLGLQTDAEPSPLTQLAHGILPGRFSDGDERRWQAARQEAASQAALANEEAVARLGLRDHLPLVLAGDGGVASPEPLGEGQCDDVLAIPGPTGRAVSTILSIDVDDEDLPSRTVQVLASASVVYASGDALVLAAPTVEGWWATRNAQVLDTTDLHWFDLDGLDVTHRASGRVTGGVLDSFALDVHGDRLRVASTVNAWGWGRGALASQLTVFAPVAGQLVPFGAVAGLAPGERLWSVRFTDDRAYLVTFRNMDPLWVIDLSAELPELRGELHVPGVSTYLHPLGDDRLLTIGYPPAGEDGLGLDWGAVQLQVFDTSDPAAPVRCAFHDLTSPGGSAHSAAVDEHKAFTYWPALGKLAVPLRTYDGAFSNATLRLVDVDADGCAFAPAGELQQTQLAPAWSSDILRSFFLGDSPGAVSVYALSAHGLSAHDLRTLQPQGSVAFPAPEYGYHGGRGIVID